MSSLRREYSPSPTIALMFDDEHRIRYVQGPIGCVSCDTEFLTPHGWKRIDEYHKSDLVAQWQDGKMSFVVPSAYVDQPCDELIEFRTQKSLSMRVSDEHRMPLWDYKNEWVVKTAQEIARKPSRYTVPTTFTAPYSDAPVTDDEIRLAVALNADGHTPRGRGAGAQRSITLRKERKRERLEALLARMGVPFRVYQHPNRGEVRYDFSSGYYGKRYEGWYWWSLSSRQLAVVLDEMRYWDGLAPDDDRRTDDIRFNTTHRVDADFMQYAAHATGARATISVVAKTNPGWSDVLVVNIAHADTPKARVMLRCDVTDIRRVPTEDGRKYCFTVPSSFWIARHNGCVFVTGNSGKTTGAIVELFRRAHMMPAGPDGVKRFRAVLVRNTRQQLRDTTQKSFFAMFPPGVAGHYRATDATFVIKTGQVEFEFLFRALDTPDDVRQLLSLELTAGFLEEAREIDEEIFSALNSRLGRYPSPAQGGCPKPFMLMVSNPPVVGSWLWELIEQKKPRNFRAFFQPPALVPGTREVNPNAENLENLDTAPRQLGDYYRDAMDTATEEFVNVYLRNQYGSVTGGQAVYREEYDASAHLSTTVLEPNLNQSIIIGADPGLTGAVVIGQINSLGQLRVLDEVCAKSVGAYRFIREQVRPLLREKYDRCSRIVVLDPAGRSRSQTDERTVYDMWRAAGFPVKFASTNNPIARIDCVKRFLTRRIEVSRGESVPGLLVSPTCHTLRSAMSGGYYYAVSQKGVMAPSPVKNGFSHVSDALQYMCLHAEAKMGFEDAAPVRLAPRLANDNWRGFTL